MSGETVKEKIVKQTPFFNLKALESLPGIGVVTAKRISEKSIDVLSQSTLVDTPLKLYAIFLLVGPDSFSKFLDEAGFQKHHKEK
jgi:hypothetical protein